MKVFILLYLLIGLALVSLVFFGRKGAENRTDFIRHMQSTADVDFLYARFPERVVDTALLTMGAVLYMLLWPCGVYALVREKATGLVPRVRQKARELIQRLK